jgi:putative addiction module component (TIGR02574 family)
MRVAEIPEIKNLSIPEKILLAEDIWDSISVDESRMPIPKSHIKELSKRLQSYEANPGNLLSLEELQGRIERMK